MKFDRESAERMRHEDKGGRAETNGGTQVIRNGGHIKRLQAKPAPSDPGCKRIWEGREDPRKRIRLGSISTSHNQQRHIPMPVGKLFSKANLL